MPDGNSLDSHRTEMDFVSIGNMVMYHIHLENQPEKPRILLSIISFPKLVAVCGQHIRDSGLLFRSE